MGENLPGQITINVSLKDLTNINCNI